MAAYMLYIWQLMRFLLIKNLEQMHLFKSEVSVYVLVLKQKKKLFCFYTVLIS